MARATAMALPPSQPIATTGPEVMNETSDSKNGSPTPSA